MKLTFSKYIVLGLVIFGLLLPSALVFFPKNAEAQLGGVASSVLSCSGFGAGNIIGGLTDKLSGALGDLFGSSSKKQAAVKVDDKQANKKEACLDKIGTAIAKMVIARMTNDIIGWINSGFKGDPLFVSNPKAFFRDLADQATGIFIEAAGATEICNLFRPDIILNIATKPVEYAYPQRISCTLDKAVGNARAFYEDFREGGWKGWLAINVEQQNNPFGAHWTTQKELANRVAKEKHQKEQELLQGSGFRSIPICDEYDPRFDKTEPSAKYEGNWNEGGIKGCRRYHFSTPGEAVANQGNLALGTSIRQAEQIDEFDEAIDAIFDALVNQLLKEGLSKLSNSGVTVTGGVSTPTWYTQAVTIGQQNNEILETARIVREQGERFALVAKDYADAALITSNHWADAQKCWAILANAESRSSFIENQEEAAENVEEWRTEGSESADLANNTVAVLRELGEMMEQIENSGNNLSSQNDLYQKFSEIVSSLPNEEQVTAYSDLIIGALERREVADDSVARCSAAHDQLCAESFGQICPSI